VSEVVPRATGPARPPDAPDNDRASQPAPQTGRTLSEFGHLLGNDGCPVCTSTTAAERTFFSWFANENHTAADVQAQLRAAMGMCAVHSRRIVEDLGAGPITTIVMREALGGALQRLRSESPGGSCAVCASLAGNSEYVHHVIIDALQRGGDALLYGQHAGMCFPHVSAVAPSAPAATTKLLAERLVDSLQSHGGPTLVALLAGDQDSDVGRRAAWRARLPEPDVAKSTVAGLSAQLAIDACPICLAAGLAERRYLRWFLDRSRANDQSLRSDPGELCAPHLHDVAFEDPAAAEHAVDRLRTVTIGGLERLLDELATLPRPGRRRGRARTDMAARIHNSLRPIHECPVCRARSTGERSQLELLAAALALAPVRRQYGDSHGLCVLHSIRMTAGSAAEMPRRHAAARVAVLAWEVGETARKYTWAARHERAGPERDAWLRGLVQIDGRVFLGGPAPLNATPGVGEHA
jgi:hypothetical protein